MANRDEIAIVGVSCRFPGAENISEFWPLLLNGENHVKEIPKHRWNVDTFYDADPNKPGKTYVRKAGFVNRYDEFDYRIFGINEMEASTMDPQQSMVLECVHMALEDGGITRTQLDGTYTGVFMGVMNYDYKSQFSENANINGNYTITGIHPSIISARVCYVYNLLGQAITLDTACSSSLVAIDLGSQSLRLGDCDTAICGGVNVILDPIPFIALSKARMLSPTGQCQTYSVNADGYARSEGCGIVILKRLQDAIRDGNKIWATLETATNQDGRLAQPITAPAGKQQFDLLERMYRKYNINKDSIQVIEAHGTGTPIGDPTEANALGAFFTTNKTSKRRLYIGSVKSNIGHLEAAAGIAGLIKVLLMMKNGTIVRSLMYSKDNENPKIDFHGYGFIVPTENTPWPEQPKNVRTACVNSFGFGGTNAHAIVHEYKDKHHGEKVNLRLPFVVTLSAYNQLALIENVNGFIQDLQKSEINLQSLTFTSTCKRDHWPARKAIVFNTKEELKERCLEFSRLSPTKSKKVGNQIVFVFCGVGTLWNGVGKALMSIPTFAESVKSVDTILKPITGWSIQNKFNLNEDLLKDSFVSHISIFVCQIGLAAVWKTLGVSPHAVVGQSVGEVAAAYVAGLIDLHSAVLIIFHRSKLLSEANGGAMVFVNNVSVEQIELFCNSNAGKVNIAVYNSPMSCTVSGDKNVITNLKSHIRNVTHSAVIIDLNVKCAYHSHYVDNAAKQIAGKLKNLSGKKSEAVFFSTVTGNEELSVRVTTGTYWAENVRKPVLFGNAVKASVSISKFNLLLELGPGPVLRVHASGLFDNSTEFAVLPSVTKDSSWPTLVQTAGKLYENGCDIRWNEIILETKEINELPKYVFWKQKTLYQNPNVVLRNQGAAINKLSHLYLERLADSDNCPQFSAHINSEATPFVYEHVVKRNILVPGAFHADAGFEAGAAGFVLPYRDISVSLEFLRPIKLEKQIQQVLTITTSRRDSVLKFKVQQGQTTVCKGIVTKIGNTSKPITGLNLTELKQKFRKGSTLLHKDIYLILEKLGFEHGKAYRVIQNCRCIGNTCLAECELPLDVLSGVERTVLHPCILDGLFQSTVAIADAEVNEMVMNEKLSFMPVAVEKITVTTNRPQKRMFIFTKRTNATVLGTVIKLHFNIILCDEDGRIIAEIVNYILYSKRAGQSTPDELRYNLTWHKEQPVDMPDNKKILCVSSCIADCDTGKELCSNNSIVCHPVTSDESFDDFAQRCIKAATEKWGTKQNIEAIIVMFERYDHLQLESETTKEIYQTTKDNCWLIVALIRHLINENIRKPLFIVTQNTQDSPDSCRRQTTDFVGSEVWGFVRSLQVEFIYGQITLIDLQPKFEDCMKGLIQFVNAAVDNIETCSTEIIISHGQIYSAEFSKTSAVSQIPQLKRMQRRDTEEFSVRTRTSNLVYDPFVVYGQHADIKNVKSNIFLRIKSVYLHLPSIYPPTITAFERSGDVWDECDLEGHKLLSVELVGYHLNASSKRLFQCSSGRIESEISSTENEWEYIAIYPVEVTSVVSVPKECTVSMKTVPFYQPGLLLASILAWGILEDLQATPGSKAVVNYSESDVLLGNIVKEMLRLRKRLTVVNGNDNEEIETFISLREKETDYEHLEQARNVICLKQAIPADICQRFVLKGKNPIKEIEPASILKRDKIAKYLRKSVPWLQKHFHKLKQSRAYSVTENESGDFKVKDQDKIEILNLPCMIPQAKIVDKASAYIVTGGLTGLGWELVLLLAEMGAGTIITLARRSVTEEKEVEVDEVQKKCLCKIICVQADVTDLQSLEKALAELQTTAGVGIIRGVFHGAGSLDSALVINLKQHQLDDVMKPKIMGALNMHLATKHLKLDYFVLQSSITSFIGSPGQSNYGAANSFLDSFAKWRRSVGLPAQSINWGALSVGMAARQEFVENFEKRGYHLLSVPELRCCFLEAMIQDNSNIVYTSLDWRLIAKDLLNPSMTRIKLKLETVISEQVASGILASGVVSLNTLDMEMLRKADTMVQRQTFESFIQDVVTRVMEIERESLKMSSTIQEIGMNSMTAITFTNIIFEFTGCRIDVRTLYEEDRSLDDIVVHLIDKLIHRNEIDETDSEITPVSI